MSGDEHGRRSGGRPVDPVHADTLPSPGLPRRGGASPSHELALQDTIDPGGIAGGSPVTIGTELGGRYRVHTHLGSGGMGDVFAAHDALLDQDVALKFVHVQLASDNRQRARLRAEVKLAQTVTHINVARTYTLEEIDGRLFIVMELLEGETLATRLRRGRPAVDEAVAIARGLLAGLEAAHARGVVHRDIKPANVKLCRDGRAVLMDFGLARVSENPATVPLDLSALASHTHTALGGTPGYIAPEIVHGHKGDERADLYSFGVVLFELMAGRPPFSGKTPLELIRAHVDQPLPAIDADVPAHLARVLERLLAKTPEQRFASAADVTRALDTPSQANLPVTAIATEIPPPQRSRRGWLVAPALLLVVAGGIVTWRLTRGTNRQPGPATVAPVATPAPDAARPLGTTDEAGAAPPAVTRASATAVKPAEAESKAPKDGRARKGRTEPKPAPTAPPATTASERRTDKLELEQE